MIRYNYLSQLQPPAPFVYVALRNPVNGAEQRDVPAQVDTATDRTLLPDTLVQALALPQIGTILIGGVGGITQTMPSYPVEVAIHNLPALTLEVVASAGEAWVLLGRDILNAQRLRNGLRTQIRTVTPPPASIIGSFEAPVVNQIDYRTRGVRANIAGSGGCESVESVLRDFRQSG